MAIPPEVVFDRAIRERFPAHLSGSYAGKMDIDPEQDLLLHDVHKLINDMYESCADHFVVEGNGSPRLHFDFIDGSAVNALAFNHDGYSFVGLTVAFVKELEQLARTLVSSESLRQLFGNSSRNSRQMEQLWTALVITMLQFVAFHELGHHLNGHCPQGGGPSVTVLEEYGPGAVQPSGDSLELQAGELDADAYAMHTLAENLLAGDPRSEILAMLGLPPSEEVDDHLLTAITLATGTVFFHRQNTPVDAINLDAAGHPPRAARLYLAVSALHEWLNANRPVSAHWVVGDQYLHVMETGTRALKNDAAGEAWNTQTSFLTSADGQIYLNSLENSRQQLRRKVMTRRWISK